MSDLDDRIVRAKKLLSTVRNASMATVNEDGTPHNSPFFFMRSTDLAKVYWGSHHDSLHSKNIIRTGQLYIVLYEANAGGGLYIEARNGHSTEGLELDEALAVHNVLRAKEGKEQLSVSYYSAISGQRMWSADVSGLWINLAKRDAEGNIIKDERYEITAEDLLS